jgi:hypothetical protein
MTIAAKKSVSCRNVKRTLRTALLGLLVETKTITISGVVYLRVECSFKIASDKLPTTTRSSTQIELGVITKGTTLPPKRSHTGPSLEISCDGDTLHAVR